MATASLKRGRSSDDDRLLDPEQPMAPAAAAWRKAVRMGQDSKAVQFDRDANEALQFYNSDHAFLWDPQDKRSFLYDNKLSGINSPAFSFTYNVMAEVVQLFAPTCYHQNPYRQANAREPIEIPEELFIDPQLKLAIQELQSQMPPPQQGGQPGQPGQPGMQPPVNPQLQMMLQQLTQQAQGQQRQYQQFTAAQAKRYAQDKTESQLIQRVLNYTPNALDLKTHCQLAVDEALITGLSWLETTLFTFPGSKYAMPGSFHVSSADVVLDPDPNMRKDCQWMAVRRVQPTWAAERKFGKKRGKLKGNLDSLARRSQYAGAEDWAYRVSRNRNGQTSDLLVYWEIFSKMGMGGRMHGLRADVAEFLDDCGDFCYLAVADGYQGLLNVPNKVARTEDADRIWPYIQWPTPYWADAEWPLTPLLYHEVPNQIYPMSHLKPALGEVRFIDFCMSFLAKKVRTVCDDMMGVLKSASDDIRAALSSDEIAGYKVLEIEQHMGKDIREIISFIQAPAFHGDIWRMLAEVAEQVAKRLGLTELAYGQSSRQYRSAAEAQTKQHNFSVRPEDMQNRTEDCMTLVARKEAICGRFHLKGSDVAPYLGEEAAMLWEKYMEDTDLDRVMREFDYRIEANSIRKPNRDRDAANMQQLSQPMLQMLENLIKLNPTANVQVLNAWVKKMGQVLDLPMADIPQLQGPAPSGPDPKMAEVQAKLELLQMQIQGKQAETQANIAERHEEAAVRQATAQIEQSRAEVELQHAREETAHDVAASSMDRQQAQLDHQQSMTQEQERHQQQMRMARAKARQSKGLIQ
jgi:hypothetical protein